MQSEKKFLPFLIAAISALGAFSLETYLPAFPAIALSLHTTDLLVQQSITAYLLTFSFMMLWHGAISDALGRRRVILFALIVYFCGCLVCIFANSIHQLWLGRAIQGMAAGAGGVVGRAIIRDYYHGAQAIKKMALIAITFSIAPALAPLIGGWLLVIGNWRSIFSFLACYGLFALLLTWRFMPETLPPERRIALHPRVLWHGYVLVLRNREFLKLAGMAAALMSGSMMYIFASPALLIRHLGLSPQSFAWVSGPSIAGMVLGNVLASRLSGRFNSRQMMQFGIAILVATAIGNIVLNLWLPPTVPWTVIPIFFYGMGVFFMYANVQLSALDLFPQHRGIAASCQSFTQTLLVALTAGVIAPLLWGSTLLLALGLAGYVLMALLCFMAVRFSEFYQYDQNILIMEK